MNTTTTTPLNTLALPPPPPLSALTQLPPLVPPIPDTILILAAPVVTYWCMSMIFHFLDTYNLLSRYRLHTPDELLKRNHVSRGEVVRDVFVQHIVQSFVGWCTSLLEPIEMRGAEWWDILKLYSRFLQAERWALSWLHTVGITGVGLESKIVARITAVGGDNLLEGIVGLLGLEPTENGNWRYKLVEVAYWYIFPAVQVLIAFFILDTWQYFWHRLMHESKWLYRTFHSRHHRLYVPYAFGALYNHPFEGLLMDTIGAGIAYKISGLTVRGGIFFFTFSTMKTVDDHSGYSLPFDPLQYFFWNNASYHDIHHQGWGIKSNFSQPFFICWDRWLGTQWTGGDSVLRYAASRKRAASAVMKDPQPLDQKEYMNLARGDPTSYSNGSATGYLNGGLKSRMLIGEPRLHEGYLRGNYERERAYREELEVEQQMERERQSRWANGEAR